MLAVVIGVGLGLLIGALLFTILLLKNKYVMLLYYVFQQLVL